ncbi:carbon-nitrogen hydrolase family protein [Candidatus Woesearchaeota archaeon]|nr:carbon-nitrogen hydrolase family protein [Candidatus Woesearchaeota archaeon]
MANKPRIALAQIKYFDIHPEHNLQKIKQYIRKAKKNNADIICFPETCVIRKKYLHSNHQFLKEIKKECKSNNIWCIITEDFLIESKLHNTSLLINREGKIAGMYKKINTYAERGVTPGRKIAVFKTDFAKIGIVICWDLAFPLLFHKLKKSGAQIVFCPAQWAYEKKAYERDHKKNELKLLRSLINSRAFENLYFVAFCSPFRNQEDLLCYSAIASPHKMLKEILNKEGIIFADLDLNETKKLKKIYPGK